VSSLVLLQRFVTIIASAGAQAYNWGLMSTLPPIDVESWGGVSPPSPW